MGKNRHGFRCIFSKKRYLTPLVAIGLSACGSLVDTSRPADERFWLEPLANNAGVAAGRPALALQVKAVPGLDTDRVLALGPDARLEQLGQARWADNLPEVLESVLARSLSAAGYRVMRTARLDDAHCLLQLEVEEFFARTSAIAVRFDGTLTCGDTTAVVASAATAARASELAAVVAGFQQALDQATRDLLDRLKTAGSAP